MFSFCRDGNLLSVNIFSNRMLYLWALFWPFPFQDGKGPPRLGLANAGMGKAEGWKSPLSSTKSRTWAWAPERAWKSWRKGAPYLPGIPNSAIKGSRRRSYHQIQEFGIAFKNSWETMCSCLDVCCPDMYAVLTSMLSWHVKLSAIEYLE